MISLKKKKKEEKREQGDVTSAFRLRVFIVARTDTTGGRDVPVLLESRQINFGKELSKEENWEDILKY